MDQRKNRLSGGQLKNGDRKFRLESCQPTPSLPPIESFKLSHILSSQLKNESNEVSSAFLKSVDCYQSDLRGGVRHKLRNEQKIQFKNIKIAKLARKINKEVIRRSKFLGNQRGGRSRETDGNSLNASITQLCEASDDSSSRIKSLVNGLSEIEKKLTSLDIISASEFEERRLKYPLVTNLLKKEQDKTDIDCTTTHTRSSFPPKSESKSPSFKEKNFPSYRNSDDINSDHFNETEENQLRQLETPSTPQISGYQERKHDKIKEVNGELDEMSPEEFEIFMASNISKYRSLQMSRQQNIPQPNINFDSKSNDVCSSYINRDRIMSKGHDMLISRDGSFTSTPKKYFSNNPLDLLYPRSQSYHEFKYFQKDASVPTNRSVKSNATVKSSFQTTHFKKLRISGDPLKPLTVNKPKTGHNRHIDTPVYSEAEADSSFSSGVDSDLDESIQEFDHGPLDCTGVDDLLDSNDSGFDDDNDDDDNQYDSAINDDGNLSGLTHLSPINANLFYKLKSVNKGAKSHRNPKRDGTRSYRKELSPNPKHEPSHHTLRPQSSILKAPLTSATVPQLANLEDIKTDTCDTDADDLSSNMKLKSSTGMDEFFINDTNVNGTFVSNKLGEEYNKKEDQLDINNPDELASINRLKRYLPPRV